MPLKLVDTAGIRETEDIVEKIGVERSRKALSEADLILLVLNQSESLTTEDKQLLDITSGNKRIILLNKTDLPSRINQEDLVPYLENEPALPISVLTSEGLDQLEQAIADLFFGGNTGETKMLLISQTLVILHYWKKQNIISRSDSRN